MSRKRLFLRAAIVIGITIILVALLWSRLRALIDSGLLSPTALGLLLFLLVFIVQFLPVLPYLQLYRNGVSASAYIRQLRPTGWVQQGRRGSLRYETHEYQLDLDVRRPGMLPYVVTIFQFFSPHQEPKQGDLLAVVVHPRRPEVLRITSGPAPVEAPAARLALDDQTNGTVETEGWLERTSGLRYAPVAPLVVERLWALANTPFTLQAFAEQWDRFSGWGAPPDTSSSKSFQVTIDEQITLVFQTVGDAVERVVVPVCYWTAYRSGDHPTQGSYAQEQAGFDELYKTLFDTIAPRLGAPYLHGLDEDDHGAYNFALWRTPHALFIVQQCAFNLGSGLEINMWLERFDQHEVLGDEFNAPSLSAWLKHRQRQR